MFNYIDIYTILSLSLLFSDLLLSTYYNYKTNQLHKYPIPLIILKINLSFLFLIYSIHKKQLIIGLSAILYFLKTFFTLLYKVNYTINSKQILTYQL
uniref:Uncharacterized protein n=1 Tax=viral metagenome TaxID=1070528 RepID=A0A6C0IY61_9ZZZZ